MPSKFNFIHVGKGLGVIHMFVLPLIYIGIYKNITFENITRNVLPHERA